MNEGHFKLQVAANFIPALALAVAAAMLGGQLGLATRLALPALGALLGLYQFAHTKKRWVEQFPPVFKRRGRIWCLFFALFFLGFGALFCRANRQHIKGSSEEVIVKTVGRAGNVVSSEIMTGDEAQQQSEYRALRAGLFFVFFGGFLLRWAIQDEICAKNYKGDKP